MQKPLPSRWAATVTSDSPVLPLFVICILSGLILVVAGAQHLPATPHAPAWAELAYAP